MCIFGINSIFTYAKIENKIEIEKEDTTFRNLSGKIIVKSEAKVENKKRKYIPESQMKQIKRLKLSVDPVKPPYCIFCDKYFCNEIDLQNHNFDEHVKGYIEFTLIFYENSQKKSLRSFFFQTHGVGPALVFGKFGFLEINFL